VRGDAGYVVKESLAHARARGCRVSVGFEITEAIRARQIVCVKQT
jgi:hypothetical protein